MIKWKTDAVVIATGGTEVLSDIIGGLGQKKRTIKYIAGPKTASLTLRLYRDGEQIVDFDTNLFTTGWTLLPVDLPLVEGNTCKAGFKDDGAGTGTYNVTIGYEEEL